MEQPILRKEALVDAAAITALVQAVVPYISAAAGAYGAAVMSRLEERAADATVGTGTRLLRRLRQARTSNQNALEAAVNDLAESPDDEDRQAALREHLGKALAHDDTLANDLREILSGLGSTVTVSATGPRSVAAYKVLFGTIHTGDVVPPKPDHS